MWMMAYNDGGEFNNIADPFNGRKLRPLIPRPSNIGTSIDHHHLSTVAEQSKIDLLNTHQVVVSSRWNPTPEQLQILEELYRRGTRTPSTDHIQHITAQLRRYGKIEGKNVFYWFQNHKARERQKRRRQLESTSSDHRFHGRVESIDQRKESGSNRTDFEVEQTKKWAHPTNCSTLAERSDSTQIAAKAACKADGWIHFNEGELQHTATRRSLAERNATWQMMQLSFSPTANLINPTSTDATTATVRTMDPNLIKAQDLSIFMEPYREDLSHVTTVEDDVEPQTLQLFPLRSSEYDNENGSEKETQIITGAMNTNNFTPCQFFEFLPLKN